MSMPLDGMKVIDLSRLSPGPYCTMLLGDMGAEVLVVEEARRPSGRRAAQRSENSKDADTRRRAAARATLGRNKQSIRLNLKHPEGREIFYRLVGSADVVLEGFRPGVAKRLGVDFDSLASRNPRLIYCSLSGYGQYGPYANQVGHDINYISIAGALGMIGPEDGNGKPAIPLNVLADYAGGGLMAAFAILCAVIAREKTGRGQNIDMAMSDGVLSLISALAATYFASGSNIQPGKFVLNGAAPYYNTYETKDGRWFSIGAIEPWFYENLCRALDCEYLIEYQVTNDEKKLSEISTAFQKQFKTKTAEEWFKILNEIDVCATPVLTLEQAMKDPHNLAREMIIEVDGADGTSRQQIGIAPKFSDTPGKVRNQAPFPGEHTERVLRDLGYSDDEISDYRKDEIVA